MLLVALKDSDDDEYGANEDDVDNDVDDVGDEYADVNEKSVVPVALLLLLVVLLLLKLALLLLLSVILTRCYVVTPTIHDGDVVVEVEIEVVVVAVDSVRKLLFKKSVCSKVSYKYVPYQYCSATIGCC